MNNYSNEEVRAALGAAATVEDVAEFLNIDYPVSMHGVKFTEPKPNFAGFKASDLEEWFNEEDKLEDGWGELALSGDRYDYDKQTYVPIKPFVHGEVAVEEKDTGGEGRGEDIYVVFSVTEDIPFLLEDDDEPRKRYFQKTGYYQSYDGSNWDGEFTEVWPKEVKVTRWVSKKP